MRLEKFPDLPAQRCVGASGDRELQRGLATTWDKQCGHARRPPRISGRQIPRNGGVILARGDDREDIEALAASDPFVSGGVATCEVIQFRASQTAAGLNRLL